MSKIIVRTEVWETRTGTVVKAVARDEFGTFLGATNQTAAVATVPTLVGAK